MNVAAANVKPAELIVFVSFSLPDNSLKNWLAHTNHVGGSVVLRGLVNNSFKETIKRLHMLNKANPHGAQIDPEKFKDFNITQVPAVMLLTHHHYDIVFGDVGLEYALSHFARQGRTQAAAEYYLSRLRSKDDEMAV